VNCASIRFNQGEFAGVQGLGVAGLGPVFDQPELPGIAAMNSSGEHVTGRSLTWRAMNYPVSSNNARPPPRGKLGPGTLRNPH